MVTIPQDIIYNIIEAVASGGDNRRLLKKCALVSSSFLLPCRKHLFSKLHLRRDRTCLRLHRFFVENPVVQSFVRSITIELYNLKLSNRTSLIALLRLPLCSLESFSIIGGTGWSWAPLNWNYFSSELKDTFSTIIHSSTLKTLHLKTISVPIMLFLGTNLTKLELTDVSSNEFDSEQSSLRLLTPGASEGVVTTASHTVVDHCVWKYFKAVHSPTEPIFLSFICCLRVLEIYIGPFSATMSELYILSLLIRSLRVSLTPATLEHLKFKIVLTARRNHFNHDEFFYDLRNADVWSHLDSIITHPTGSQLQRVDINIKYAFRYDDDIMEPDNTEVSKPVLDALPLLREKGILFVKATRY